jgi:hypothetical protein
VNRIKDVHHGQKLHVVFDPPTPVHFAAFERPKNPIHKPPSPPYDTLRSSGLVYYAKPPIQPKPPRTAAPATNVQQRGRSKSESASHFNRQNIVPSVPAINPTTLPPPQFSPAPPPWTQMPLLHPFAFRNNFMVAPIHVTPFAPLPGPMPWGTVPWVSHHVSGPSPSTEVPQRLEQAMITPAPQPVQVKTEITEFSPKPVVPPTSLLDAMEVRLIPKMPVYR